MNPMPNPVTGALIRFAGFLAALLLSLPSPAMAQDLSDAPLAANQFRLRALPVLPELLPGAAVGRVDGALLVVGGVEAPITADRTVAEGRHWWPANNLSSSFWVLPALPAPSNRERGLNRIRESFGREIPQAPDLRQWAFIETGVAMAYPAAVVQGGALHLAGGFSPEGLTDRVRRIQQRGGVWEMDELPRLPEALALSGAAVLGNRLYVAGGICSLDPLEVANRMWVLDLSALDGSGPAPVWQSIDLPYSSGVVLPTLTVRRDEVAIADALFLAGGWQLADAAAESEIRWLPHREVFKYLAPEQSHSGWTRLRDAPEGVALDTAIPVGPAHIVLTGRPIDPAGLSTAELLRPPADDEHAVLKSYHLFTNSWVSLQWPALDLLEPRIFNAGGQLLVTGREPAVPENSHGLANGARPLAGPVSVREATLIYAERHFSTLDYLAMVIYLLALVAIGKYFARRDKGTEYFFLGGRKIPWWAAGLSIYATGTSAISFMAIPAKTYMTDWLYFIGMSIFPFFTLILAAYLFIPLLRRLEITTVMEYFDLRFGRPIRFLMSFVSVMGQLAGRMSITLLLPALALTAVTGMDLYLSILIMGVLATLYTVMGGINAVIWTDVLQVGVLFGGAILSFALILYNVDGGFTRVIGLAVEENKFNLFDFRPDLTTATMWIMLLWAVSDVFAKGLGQEGLQRAFSTPDVKAARRSMITCAVVALPAGFLFYGIGTALFAYYSQHPEALNPTLDNDAIFPLFIAQQLPAGLAGLVISALFAAAMSTLDTAMNSVSAIVTRDFYAVFRKNAPEREQMCLAKWVTIFCGVFGTGIALYIASFENLGSLWDRFSILLSLIGGGLGGVGALALLTTRANTYGTLIGIILTSAFIYWLKFHAPAIPGISPLHFFAYGTASLVVGFLTGYLFSWLIELVFPQVRQRDLSGLTLWTPGKV